MHILVVEDDIEYRNVLREALQMHGHLVVTATDGAEAFELLQHHPVGLIISDINMPNCTGTKLHELIRSDEHLELIPFIYVTGFAILRVATPLAKTELDFMVSKVSFDRLLQLIGDISLGCTMAAKNDMGVGLV